MPEFTITRRINAPIQTVWEVLDDFGDIQRWNPGVAESALTSDGPVCEGTTRHCAVRPFGRIKERIVRYLPQQRMTVEIYETFKLPISQATADFGLTRSNGATLLTLDYRYELNSIGRFASRYTDSQLRRGIGGLAKALQAECEAKARPEL